MFSGNVLPPLQQERVNKKAVKQFETKKSALAVHCKETGHQISCDSTEIIRTCPKWHERRVLEAWEINVYGEKAITGTMAYDYRMNI